MSTQGIRVREANPFITTRLISHTHTPSGSRGCTRERREHACTAGGVPESLAWRCSRFRLFFLLAFIHTPRPLTTRSSLACLPAIIAPAAAAFPSALDLQLPSLPHTALTPHNEQKEAACRCHDKPSSRAPGAYVQPPLTTRGLQPCTGRAL